MTEPSLAEARKRLEALVSGAESVESIGLMARTADVKLLLSTLDQAAEVLGPFAATKDGGMKLVADLPDRVKLEIGGKVPRRNEWFEIGSFRPEGVTLGDFRRAASLHAQLTAKDPS